MSNPKQFPWELNAALLPERLQVLAEAARTARNAVINAQDPDRDDAWCTCCRAYTWTRKAFGAIQRGNGASWMRTKESGLAFTFYIDGVPMKFYRGSADQPKTSSLRSGVREMLSQSRLDFLETEIRDEADGWFWLMAIDTDVEGRVLEVVVFQANAAEEVRYPWSVPLDGRTVSMTSVTDVRREGVKQEPADIGVPGDGAVAVGDDDKDDEE